LCVFFVFSFVLFGCFIFTNKVNATTTPDQISGLKLWLDASSGVTTDGSTQAVDGDPIKQWNDLSTSSANAIQATVGNRPVYKTNIINGKPVIRFNGSPQNMITSSFLDSSFDNNFTYFMVASKENGDIEVSTSNGDMNWYTGGQEDHFIANTGNLNPDQITGVPAGNNFSISDPTIETFKYDGTNATLRVSGRQKSVSTTGALGLSGGLTIGSLSSNNFYYHGDIAEIIIYNSVLSDTQIEQIESYLMNKYGIVSSMPPASIPLIIFDGDSMTYGNGSTDGQNYPFQTQTLLGINATYQNLGVPGQTVLQMDNDADIQIDTEYLSSRTTNIISLFGGTNDIAQDPNQDAITTYNRIVSYSQARRAAGFKVIVNTILPRSEGLYSISKSEFETTRQTVNNLIRTNWKTFADGISDIASDSNIGQLNDSDNLTYYVDGIHLTNNGYGIIASYVSSAIKQIIDPISISNIATVPSSTTANISWTTNQNGSTSVNYGIDSSYGSSTTESDVDTRVLNHSVSLSGLTACTTYHFKTISNDLNGNQMLSDDQSFKTTGCNIPSTPNSSVSTGSSGGSSVSSRYNYLISMGNLQIAEELKKQFPNQINTVSPIKNTSVVINKILKLSTPPMKGDDVLALQTYLSKKGYDVGNLDGNFGLKTKTAVIKFQIANTLKGDGIVGPLTKEFIK